MEQTSADMIVRSGNLTELKGGIQVKIGSFWKYIHSVFKKSGRKNAL